MLQILEPSGPAIRVATPADLPAMLALERTAETAAHWSEETYNSIFRNGGPQRLAIVMETEAGLAAFVVVRIIGEEWEIENVVVGHEVRRQGIGSSLIRKLITRAHAKNAERILLEVRASNMAARALYQKAGFQVSGVRSRYYCDPIEDAISYTLDLKAK